MLRKRFLFGTQRDTRSSVPFGFEEYQFICSSIITIVPELEIGLSKNICRTPSRSSDRGIKIYVLVLRLYTYILHFFTNTPRERPRSSMKRSFKEGAVGKRIRTLVKRRRKQERKREREKEVASPSVITFPSGIKASLFNGHLDIP